MSKKTFYLVRHGQTYFSKNNVPYGNKVFTARLLKSTYPAVEKIGEYLARENIEQAYCSEILRARQTAKIIAKKSGIVFDFDKRLNEIADESFIDVETRVKSFLDDVDKIPSNNILVLTHGAIIAAIKSLIFRGKFRITDLPGYPKPETVVIIKGAKYELLDFSIPEN